MKKSEKVKVEFESRPIMAEPRELRNRWTVVAKTDEMSPGVRKMVEKMICLQEKERARNAYEGWRETHAAEDRGVRDFERNVYPTLERIREL